MPDLLIRNLTDAQLTGLDDLAQQAKLSRQKFMERVIEDLLGEFDPDLVLGFVKLWSSELNTGDTEIEPADCPQCDQPFDEVWIGFYAGHGQPVAFGPVCGRCATTI